MTDEAKALVIERLRETWCGYPGMDDRHLRNPDGPEAADLIETQAREIERLSYALGCIANEDWKDMTVGSTRDLARSALGESHD